MRDSQSVSLVMITVMEVDCYYYSYIRGVTSMRQRRQLPPRFFANLLLLLLSTLWLPILQCAKTSQDMVSGFDD